MSMNEDMSKWTISQEGKTIRIRDGDGLLITKFDYEPLSEDGLKFVLDFNKYIHQKMREKMDEMILNGGIQ